MCRAEDSNARPVLVSACLLGRECRYDATHNRRKALEEELSRRGERPLPFCPEEEGGLPTPRPPAWIETVGAAAVIDGTARVVDGGGNDVSAPFLAGARAAADACTAHGARKAYLKERSPSCGVLQTHVAGRLVDGPGITAELLSRAGIEVVGIE